MDDVGQLLLAVRVGILHTELARQQHVNLNRDQRVLLAEHILVLNIQLGAIERGLVDADGVLYAQIFQYLSHYALRFFPLFRRALVLVLGVSRIPLAEAEGALIEQAQRAQEVLSQIKAALELLLQLIGTQYKVAFGDRELTHADEAVHLARILIAEQRRGFAQAHRKVAVAAHTR